MSRTSAPRWALSAITASVAAVAATALLGPSAAVSPLPGRRLGPLPPYALSVHPPAGLVTALLVAATVLGVAGLLGGLRALAHGWCPDPRRLVAAGALAAAALAMLPPVGSADAKSYAAYGRMAATGHDPYATTAADLTALGDPVGAAVEVPWRDSPSVYGPLATAEQALVARAAGGSTRGAVGLLGLLNAAAFVAAGLLLQRLAGTPDRRRRAALLWLLNPLLLFQLVAGAHLDTIVALAVTGALVLAARAPLAAGVAAGAAAAIKLPGAAIVVGLGWAARHSRPRLLTVVGATAAVLAASYALAGPHALGQVRAASRFVSWATPWRPLADVLDPRYGDTISRRLISYAAVAIGIGLVLLLLRALPPGDPAVRVTLAVSLGYVLAAPYALPWYDATAWALLALVPRSAFDALLTAHTAVLTLAYVPGRAVPLSGSVAHLAGTFRTGVAPWLLLSVAIVAVVTSRRRA